MTNIEQSIKLWTAIPLLTTISSQTLKVSLVKPVVYLSGN